MPHLNSCKLTQEVVWGAKIDRDEIVKDLLINEDGTRLIVIAKKYYYFADDEKNIVKKMSSWEGKEKLETSVDFGAKGKQAKVEIYFEAFIKDLSKKQIEFLKDLGGKQYTDNSGNKKISSRLTLKGIRLVSNSDLIKNKMDGFLSTGLMKSDYKAAIFEDLTPPQIAGKILLTPFAVAADILLAPIYFIGILGMGVGGH